MTAEKLRVLILTSSTGGGHNMRASSFAHWMHRAHPDTAEVQIHKCLENTHGLYSFGVGLYNWIQRNAPWAHHGYFNFLEAFAPCGDERRIFGAARFRAILDHVRPHVVLSTHGSLNHGFFELARAHLGADRVRCVTYCGELFGKYGFSRHWVNPAADLFIGAVTECCAMARRLGMSSEKTVVGGFLLNPTFYEPPFTPEERARFLADELGLDPDPDRFTLLLSTSEHGAHNHPALLESLYAARRTIDLDRVQVVALCGRHHATLERVSAWARRHPGLLLRPMPRTSRMAQFMRAASAIVARPGTGTTSESIMTGCPMIYNGLGGVMPQEFITLKYARRHGLAAVMHRPVDLPLILANWLDHPTRFVALRARIADARPHAHPTEILARVRTLAAPLLAMTAANW